MKKILSILLAAVMVISLAACGSSQISGGNDSQTSGSSADVGEEGAGYDEESNVTENTETVGGSSSDEGNEISKEAESSILVVYFSLAGEQYNVGVIEEGNTSIIAHMIAEQTGADLFEIEPVEPYPETYNELLTVAQEEAAENARPEIAGTVENWDEYDTVFIGYPIWWGDMPMILYTFLETYDFNDKTVIPFCTHGGSGLAGTDDAIADITGAAMLEGFAIAGTTAQNNRDEAQTKVNEWLSEIGLIEE